MQALLHAISGVLTLIFMGLIGCYLAKIGWINKDNKALLPKLVTNISLPLFFIYNITHAFSHDQLLHLITGSIVPFISIGVCFILSVFLARFMSKKGHRGIFQSTFTTSNTIFVGLPVTMALFGEEAIPYTLLYFFANTTFFWTLGNSGRFKRIFLSANVYFKNFEKNFFSTNFRVFGFIDYFNFRHSFT